MSALLVTTVETCRSQCSDLYGTDSGLYLFVLGLTVGLTVRDRVVNSVESTSVKLVFKRDNAEGRRNGDLLALQVRLVS